MYKILIYPKTVTKPIRNKKAFHICNSKETEKQYKFLRSIWKTVKRTKNANIKELFGIQNNIKIKSTINI